MNAVNLKTVMTKTATVNNCKLFTAGDRIGQGLMVVTMPLAKSLSQGHSLPQRPEPEQGSRQPEEVLAMRYLPTTVTPIGSIGRISGPHTRGDLFALNAAKRANRLLGTPPQADVSIDAIWATPSWCDDSTTRFDADCQSAGELNAISANRGCKQAATRSAIVRTSTSES